ncbi:FAD-dependent monooxygenase [Sphaerisporangium dianthi]|uniref:FAD-dependent monooxygenase n=1 Tax=Sphaerisporangium dianthi TaxID=1436120 RepID=A0ABV9CQM3_9ACTN
MKNSLPVLVVGAGPTGLALATELRKRGLECRIIDQASDRPANQARALTLWPGALDVLARHGTAEEVVDAGLRMNAARYWSRGKNVASVSFGDAPGGGPAMLGITQPAVEAVMIRRLAELGLDVEWRTTLVTLADQGDRVLVRLAGPGGEEEFTASWVVGCDGAHSSVRELCGIPFAGRTYSRSFVLGDGAIDGPVPRGEAHYHLHPDGVLVVVSLPSGDLRVFADATKVGALDASPTIEDLQRLADDRAPYRLDIKELRWSTRFLVHMRQAASYRSGRCLLAGDAAHVHSPAGGQGLNTGIQDAANLGWKLSLILQGSGHADRLLESYEAERSPVAAQVLKGAHLQTRLWTVRSPVARFLRDRLLSTLGRTGILQRRFIPQLAQDDLDYRRSPVVGPHGGRRALGARGLPDTVVTRAADGGHVRLRQVLSDDRHILLVLAGADGADSAPVRAAVSAAAPLADRLVVRVLVGGPGGREASPAAAPAAGEVYELPDGYAPQGALSGCKLVLVRPDGYVAGASATFDVEPLIDVLGTGAREPVAAAPGTTVAASETTAVASETIAVASDTTADR